MAKLTLYSPATDSLKLFRPLLQAKTDLLRARRLFPAELQADFEKIGVEITSLIRKAERFFNESTRQAQ